MLKLIGTLHGGYSSSLRGMAEPLYLIPTGQGHLTWHSLQMPLAPLAMASTMPATGLLNPGQPFYRTAPSSGKNFTLLLLFPAYCGVTYGLGRRLSSTATTSLWSISGLPVPPVTLISCTSFAPYFSMVQLTILQS